jgi:hypothetical protein
MTWQTKPFQAILKRSIPFIWTDELDKVFHQSRKSINTIIREMKKVCSYLIMDQSVWPDWSVDGIGFFMMQKYCQCALKTAFIDGKALAVEYLHTSPNTLSCTGMQGSYCCYGHNTSWLNT